MLKYLYSTVVLSDGKLLLHRKSEGPGGISPRWNATFVALLKDGDSIRDKANSIIKLALNKDTINTEEYDEEFFNEFEVVDANTGNTRTVTTHTIKLIEGLKLDTNHSDEFRAISLEDLSRDIVRDPDSYTGILKGVINQYLK